jgi:hypothetical protein
MVGRDVDVEGADGRRPRPLRAREPQDRVAEPIEAAEPYLGDSPTAGPRRGGGGRPAPVSRSAAGTGSHYRADDGGPPTQAVPGLSGTGSAAALQDGRAGRPSTRRDRRAGGGLRYRVLPRSLLGISSMILAFAVGAAFSGTILYAYYQYHLDQTDQRVNALVDGYKRQFSYAEGDLLATAAAAKAEVQASINASHQSQTDPAAQEAIIHKLAGSLFFVSTQDAAGQSSVGSAFVVASNSTDSLLLTSYTTVQAATNVPGPEVFVRQAATGQSTQVTVRTWDATRDLALIVLPRGGLPPVTPAPTSPSPQDGQTVFAVAGLGSAGGSIATGEIDDVSSSGIADDIPLGPAFQGAPIVDTSGQVVAVASRTYSPLGFTSDSVWYAPFVDMACERVLSCPGGKLSSSS